MFKDGSSLKLTFAADNAVLTTLQRYKVDSKPLQERSKGGEKGRTRRWTTGLAYESAPYNWICLRNNEEAASLEAEATYSFTAGLLDG